MSQQYSANKKENEGIKNFLCQLKEKDKDLIEAFEEQELFSKIREIEIQYENLAKLINKLYAGLNLDHIVRTSYEEEQIDTARANFFTEYRSQLNQTRLDETPSLEDSTQITPILSQGKNVKFQLKPSILNLDAT